MKQLGHKVLKHVDNTLFQIFSGMNKKTMKALGATLMFIGVAMAYSGVSTDDDRLKARSRENAKNPRENELFVEDIASPSDTALLTWGGVVTAVIGLGLGLQSKKRS